MHKKLYLLLGTFLVFTGCVKRYSKHNLSNLTQKTAHRIHTQADITVMSKVWNEDTICNFFGGFYNQRIAHIQATIQNNSNYVYTLEQKDISLPLMHPYSDDEISYAIGAGSILSAFSLGASGLLIARSFTEPMAIAVVNFMRTIIVIPIAFYITYSTYVISQNKKLVAHARAQVFDTELIIPAHTTVNTLFLVNKEQFEQESCSLSLHCLEQDLTFDL